MWVKLEVVDLDYNIIFLPLSMAGRLKDNVFVCFGKKKVLAKLELVEDVSEGVGLSFESAAIVKVSKKLKEHILIIEGLTYQLKLDSDTITIGPVIALLLGTRNHRYSPEYMDKYSDRLGVYKNFGGLVYAFSYTSIDWENGEVYGLYYDNIKVKWIYGRFPLPTVIYRRNFHISTKSVKDLFYITQGKLFNSVRFTKYDLYEFVGENEQLASYLIPTEMLRDLNQVKVLLEKYKKVILKPIDLSRGRGICIIEKTQQGFKLLDYRSKEGMNIYLKEEKELESFFSSNKGFYHKYLIQKYVELAKVGSSPFDIRVVMQKNRKKLWSCTGIECRVAKKGNLITNISRGGYALPLPIALLKAFPNYQNHELLMWEVDYFCKKLCAHMDKMGEHFGEFGLDVAFDEDKNLWLIEANVFPSFKGFKIMDYETYLKIRHTPLIYAVALSGFEDTIIGEGDKNEHNFSY